MDILKSKIDHLTGITKTYSKSYSVKIVFLWIACIIVYYVRNILKVINLHGHAEAILGPAY